ncbi:MAG: hypothetical protein QXH10_10555 [Ignisphaera sp.]
MLVDTHLSKTLRKLQIAKEKTLDVRKLKDLGWKPWIKGREGVAEVARCIFCKFRDKLLNIAYSIEPLNIKSYLYRFHSLVFGE